MVSGSTNAHGIERHGFAQLGKCRFKNIHNRFFAIPPESFWGMVLPYDPEYGLYRGNFASRRLKTRNKRSADAGKMVVEDLIGLIGFQIVAQRLVNILHRFTRP
jgi:hypothetical protein